MTFNEFFEYLEGSTRAAKGKLAPFSVSFKPYREDAARNALPAGHPEINQDVFSVYTGFLRQNSFKITYPFHPSVPEKTDLDGLRRMFDEYDWSGFVVYNPESEARRQFG